MQTNVVYHFILNEAAGSGKGKAAFDALLPYLAANHIAYTLTKTTQKSDAKQIATRLQQAGATHLVVVGGDGTLHEVVGGLTSYQGIHIGIIPGGTGNDFALPLGIPRDPIAAFSIIERGNTMLVDVMDIGGVPTVCFATSGLDIPLVNACNALKKKKKNSYLFELIKQLLKNKSYPVTLVADGTTTHYDAHIFGFANTGVIASGMRLVPTARANSGVLDAFVIEKMPKRKLLGFVKSLYNGTVLQSPYLHHLETTQATFTLLSGDTINLDGELYPNTTAIVGQIASEKLCVFVP